MAKKLKFSLSGVGIDEYHDGTMTVDYVYILPTIPAAANTPITEQDYSYFMNKSLESSSPSRIAINYTIDQQFDITKQDGIITNNTGGINYSIYRREYQNFERIKRLPNSTIQVETETYAGPWEPVVLLTQEPMLRDFNVTANRSYQYVLYPRSGQVQQLYANVDEETNTSTPVKTHWDAWSIAELIPVETPVDAPIIKKAYTVDINNIWLFKYSLNTGDQSQNFQKQDVQTLGQYNRFGYGQQNYISGSVSCLLGSEIVPYSKEGYIERRRESISAPLSTNEKIEMLRQWRKIAFSPNPKLLKDIKGQSWIVQIVSNSNSPQNFYRNQPDTISFSWKEIGSLDKVTITGVGYEIPEPGQCHSIWEPEGYYFPWDRQ